MKTKNKILILIIFSILIFFFTGLDVFATDLNDYCSESSDLILQNFDISDEIKEQVYIITANSSRLYVSYFNPSEYDTFSKLCLYNKNSTIYIDSCDSDGNLIPNYRENFYKRDIYSISDNFTTFTFLEHREPTEISVYLTIDKCNIDSTSDVNFVTSNCDIYDTDKETMVFQHPVEQSLVGLIPLETLRPTQVQEKIAETLKTMIPISLAIFSALLSPFLIRYLICRLK